METADTKRFQLIPDVLRRPHFLLWFLVLPQLLLLLLNYRSWLLVGDDMSPEQVQMAMRLLTCQLSVLAAGLILTAGLFMARKRVNWLACIPIILVHAAYLWLFTRWVGKLLPPNVVLWILPEPLLLYHQYAFTMPAIFYAALLLACAPIKLHRPWDIAGSILTMIGVPFMVFLILQAGLWASSRGKESEFETVVIMVFVIAATTVTMLAFFRVLMYLYTWIKTYRRGPLALAVLAGLAAPLGGLLLNITIPFPYDFQAPEIYVLTVINGIVLLLPFARDGKHALATWCLRAAMYPFTLYFFMVFLPFLPLSLLAMIAAGAGFLILAPTLLFAVHTRRLVDEWSVVKARVGIAGGLALLLMCLATIPALYTARAILDKRALMNAVDYVYSQDPAANAAPNFALNPAKRALSKLNRRKNGIYVPFLSEYYSRLVFANMVLPDYKMTHIYTTLFGEDLDVDRQDSMFTGFLGMRSNARRAMQGGTTPPPRNVTLSDITVAHDTTNGIALAHVALTLQNKGRANAEFVTDIHIPRGVLVSDYWLDVEGEQVPARVFERKTAMWVYHMIRDVVRRDPGLLVYSDPETLRLNVFPFATRQTRTTGLTFMFPKGATPTVRIGGKDLPLAPQNTPEAPLAVRIDGKDQTFVYLNEAKLKELPPLNRKPSLHLFLDVSSGTTMADGQWFARIEQILPKFHHAENCVLSLVNRRIVWTSEPVPVTAKHVRETLRQADWDTTLREGGFCPERAIKYLLAHGDSEGGSPSEVPIFVALAETNSNIAIDGDLAPFARFVPDHPVYYLARGGGSLTRTQFRSGYTETVKVPDETQPIIHIRNDAGGDVALANAPGAVLSVPGNSTAIRFSDGAEEKPLAVRATLDTDDRYAHGLRLWARQQQADRNPQLIDELLPRLVHDSRQERILIPATSFIVVESDAQWKMLQEKEKQSLAADHALEFDEHQESPAPSVWFLAPVVLALLWWGRRRP